MSATFVDLRPLQKQTAAEMAKIQQMLKPVEKQLSSFVLLPTLTHDQPLRLLLATRHYANDALLPHGVVISVQGTTPIYGPLLTDENTSLVNLHLFVNERTGTGVGMYNITSPITENELRQRFEQAKNDNRLPLLIASTPTQRIVVAKLDNTNQFVIVVTANDAARAVHLMEILTSASTPVTADELCRSTEYRELVESSQKYRDYLAAQMASALGVTISSAPTVSQMTHTIAQAAKPGVVHLFHDAYNTETAHQGVLITSGASGDVAHVFATADGKTPIAWQNAASSSIHTSVGQYIPGFHAYASKSTSATQYSTELPGVPHPLTHADRLAPSIADPSVVNAIDRTKGAHELVTNVYKAIGQVLPNVTTMHYPTKDELVEYAKNTTAKAIYVPLDHPVVGHIAAVWNAIKAELPPSYTWANAIGSEFRTAIDPILGHHSLHPDTQFKQTTSTDVSSTISSGLRYGGFAGHRRRRYFFPRGLGFTTALALDTALLLRLGLSPFPYQYPYTYPYPYYY